MACNCATAEQLNELYKRYGEKKAEKKSFGLKLRLAIQKICIVFCLIFIAPVIVGYVVCKSLFTKNHKINVMDFLGIHKKEIGTNVG